MAQSVQNDEKLRRFILSKYAIVVLMDVELLKRAIIGRIVQNDTAYLEITYTRRRPFAKTLIFPGTDACETICDDVNLPNGTGMRDRYQSR